MTRVIAGTHGGRTLRTPPGSGTRPTSDRVREALFSALDARGAVAGAHVLDLYAGSGALGLEAMSRGARSAVLVESDRPRGRDDRRERARPRPPGGAGPRPTVAPPWPPTPPRARQPTSCSSTRRTTCTRRPWPRCSRGSAQAGWPPGGLVVVERSSRSPEPAWPAGLERVGKPRRYGETTVWLAASAAGAVEASCAVPAGQRPCSDRMTRMSDYEIPRPVSGDVIERILDDHRLFEELLREARRTDSDRAAARQALAEVLVAHATAEEEKVYPTLRRKAEDITPHEAEHGEEEHAEITEALLAFLRCAGTDTQKSTTRSRSSRRWSTTTRTRRSRPSSTRPARRSRPTCARASASRG